MRNERRSQIDKQVARQAQKAREATGITLECAADSLGVSFQQMQKYMIGSNRMSAGTLYVLAECFDFPVEYFYSTKAPIQYLRDKESGCSKKK